MVDPFQAIEEARKQSEEIARATIVNETQLAVRIIEINRDAEKAKLALKISHAEAALKNQEKLTGEEKDQLNNEITQLKNALELVPIAAQARINAEKGKAYLKDFENNQKNEEQKLKSEEQTSKQLVELIEKRVSKTSKEEEKRLDELNAAKLALIEISSEQELNEVLNKNAEVIKADEKLKAALASGNQGLILDALKAASDAREVASATDVFVIESNRKKNEAIDKQNKAAAFDKRAFEISEIKDLEERNRLTQLLEVDKTYEKEIEAARGNEQLKTEAFNKATKARKAIEEDAARSSDNLWIRSEQLAKDFSSNFFDTIANSVKPANTAFTELEKKFGDFADTVAKSNEEITKSTKEEYDKTTALALGQLIKREISYDQYVKTVDEAGKKSNKSQISLGDKLAAAAGKNFLDIGKNAQKHITSSFDSIGKKLKENGNQFENVGEGVKSFFNDAGSIVNDVAISSAASLGTLAASGQLTMETAKQATLGIAFDAVSGLILTYAPAIIGSAVAFLGPIFGPIAGGALLAVVQGLLAAAKGALGFKTGGYTGDGPSDESAGIVHKGEGVLEQPVMRGQVKEFLELRSLLQNGVSIKEVLGTYKESKSAVINGMSIKEVLSSNNLSVTPDGSLVVNSQTAPLTQSMTSEGVYIRALERQTAELRADNAAIKTELIKNRTTLRQIESTVNIAPVTLKASGDDLQAVMQKKMKYRMNYGG